jgi:hypothetical protein
MIVEINMNIYDKEFLGSAVTDQFGFGIWEL